MLRKLFSQKRKKQRWKQLMAEIEEAKKDPEWRKELKQFIKITTS
jgi:trimethylamine:corrinoid methyltransferase-like protein